MKSISHSGEIVKIQDGEACVKIESRAACASCQMSKNCMMSEMVDKFVDVKLDLQKKYVVGQKVAIVITQSQGWLAVFLAYIFPLLLVVSALVTLIFFGVKEGIAAIVSLALLLPYYFILSKFRGKISEKFQFYLKE
ncbi:MAG: SoxR reducing system RseC family protein [Lentimicrobiaceae bacterium]|nr:SoxR reducing system RseC family protein [Lentimicrobiaceae bacterium]